MKDGIASASKTSKLIQKLNVDPCLSDQCVGSGSSLSHPMIENGHNDASLGHRNDTFLHLRYIVHI